MLPIRPLDDQMFEDSVLRARRRISRLTSEWTDENLHDPGITMVELLAFMKEMQQYHLDRVPERNIEKFLKLLGARTEPATPAHTHVWVNSGENSYCLPVGVPFAAGDVIFETEVPETVVSAEVSSLVTRTRTGISVSMEIADVHEAFGARPEEGDELFICLTDELPVGREINLSFTIAQPRGGKRNPITEDFIPLSEVAFSYSAGEEWKPLRVISEGTGGFLQSGLIRFELPELMTPAAQGPVAGSFAIRCQLVRSEFDDIPLLEWVKINVLPVIQRRTLVHWMDIGGMGEDCLDFPLNHHLALYGKADVFLRREDGYIRLRSGESSGDGGEYHVRRDGAMAHLVLENPPLCDSLHVVLSEKGIDGEYLFDGDDLPGQRVVLENEGLLMQDIMLMERDARGIYREYTRVDNFDRSTPEDRHFCWDAAEGELVFGDGKNGMPPSGAVYVARHARTLGVEGNVKAGEVRRLAGYAMPPEIRECQLENLEHVSGGSDAQTLDEALSLVRRDISKPTYAVTLSDYESIALQTPGLVIRRACALPMPPPGVTGIAGMNAVMVVVEAGSGAGHKGLSAAQKENLLRHLNRYRLVTTRVYVIPPEYVSIQVHCDVRSRAQHLHPEQIIQRALEEYFSVEWPFGRSVQYADIYGLLDTLECVSAVHALTIGAQGRGVQVNVSGDVILPPHGLAVLGDCVCRVTTR